MNVIADVRLCENVLDDVAGLDSRDRGVDRLDDRRVAFRLDVLIPTELFEAFLKAADTRLDASIAVASKDRDVRRASRRHRREEERSRAIAPELREDTDVEVTDFDDLLE